MIVGAGPSGLASAIRLRQLAEEKGRELSVCVIEDQSWRSYPVRRGDRAARPERTTARLEGARRAAKHAGDRRPFLLLGKSRATRLPTPPPMKAGNYIVSLGNFCRWLGEQAGRQGVEIYPGFAAAGVLTKITAR